MSSRQARKLKQQIGLKEQEKLSEAVQGSDDEEDEQPVQQKKPAFFAMMSGSENSSEEEDDDEEGEESEKEVDDSDSQKGKDEEERIAEEERKKEEEARLALQREEEEKKEKLRLERLQKKLEKKNRKTSDEVKFEQIMEKAAKEVEEQEEEESKNDSKGRKRDQHLNDFELVSTLQILKNKLNYNKEIQRYFKGAKLSDAATEGENPDQFDTGHGSKRRAKMIANELKKRKRLAQRSIKQMNLVHNSDKAWLPVPDRFACEFVGENKLGQKMYAFKPSKTYEQLQETFLMLQDEMDPQVIFDFINSNPFHIDGLYNMFEFFNLRGQFKDSNQLLEQILYIYEDSFGFEFSQIFDDTKNRFALAVEGNKYGKTFFAAMLKFVDLLGKKGCYRAALEYNKVLLKLNPEVDPAGALLCLDYSAISCKAYDYLIFFIKNFAVELFQNPNYSIQYMPNFIYSAALAKFCKVMLPPASKDSEDSIPSIGTMIDFKEADFTRAIDFKEGHIDENANVILITAILLYPKLIKTLCIENEFTKTTVGHSLFKNWQKKPLKELLEHEAIFSDRPLLSYSFLRSNSTHETEGLSKLFEIYVERSKIMWKDNKIVIWIQGAIGFILNELERRADSFKYEDFLKQLCEPRTKNILPFPLNRYRVLLKANFSDHIDRLDLANIPDDNNNVQLPANANQNNQNYNPINTNQGFLSLLAQSILPWVNLPQQNPNNQRPQMDLELVEDLLAQEGGQELLQQLHQQRGAGNGDDDEDDFEDDFDSEDDFDDDNVPQ